MTSPLPTTAPRRRGAWLTDRPVAVKIGAVLVLLALVAAGLTAMAVTRISALSTGEQHLQH